MAGRVPPPGDGFDATVTENATVKLPATGSTASDADVPPPPPTAQTSGAPGAPRVADGIELIGEFEGSGYKDAPFLARRADGQVIQMTQLLHLIAEHCDGQHDYAAIAAAVSDAFDRRVTADNVEFLIDKKLRPLGVVTAPDGSAPEVKKADPLLALKFKKVLIPERAVGFLTILFKPLFWPPVILGVLAATVAFDVWYFTIHGVAPGIRNTIYQPGIVVMLYGLLVLSVAWHEIGHATACRYGGARPGVVGFGIYIVWPAFYTDVTDAYRLGKGGRVRTDLGGIYFNLIFSLIMGGVYFVTGFEPLLLVVLLQHVLILYQFMPFLRLDGYYVVSDLTGVPDLFGRIKPTLASLVPWKKSTEAVTQLKPSVRLVVTLWVMLVIPFLLYAFAMMVISAPRIGATAYDSFLSEWDKVSGAMEDGKVAVATGGGFRMAMLVLPLMGMTVTFGRVGKRIVSGALSATQGKPIARTFSVAMLLGLAGAAGFVLLPNGEYKPLQPGERGTLQESFQAVSAFTSGRPGLTEEREQELRGAPFRRPGVDRDRARDGAPGTGEQVNPDDGEGAPEPAPEGDPTSSPSSESSSTPGEIEESPSSEPTSEPSTEPTPTPTSSTEG